MSLFNFKKEEAKKDSKDNTSLKAVAVQSPKETRAKTSDGKSEGFLPFGDLHILRPRVTEKSSVLSSEARKVLVFEVSRAANKRTVALSVKELFKAIPEKVSIVKIPPKATFVRGKLFKGRVGYKAFVYFKKGEKLEI